MDKVTFDEEQYAKRERLLSTKNRSAIVKFLVSKRITDTEKGANFIIIGLAVIFFLMAIIVLLFGVTRAGASADGYLQMAQAMDQAKVVLKPTATLSGGSSSSGSTTSNIIKPVK